MNAPHEYSAGELWLFVGVWAVLLIIALGLCHEHAQDDEEEGEHPASGVNH